MDEDIITPRGSAGRGYASGINLRSRVATRDFNRDNHGPQLGFPQTPDTIGTRRPSATETIHSVMRYVLNTT